MACVQYFMKQPIPVELKLNGQEKYRTLNHILVY